ncbi:MAG: hypothetical protein IKV85_05865 [Ruminococcus sp.]|nr:hypothetical protein [Ruminococcus sp.]
MCENKKIKNAVIRIVGIIFVITAIILRLFDSYIGGAFQEFSDAAFPWITIGIAVAVVLSVRFGKEEITVEKQNTGIEKKS